MPRITKFVLSAHAVQRMEERRVHLNDIKAIVSTPDFVLKQGAKFILAKELENRSDNLVGAVLLEKESSPWLVVTVMVNFAVRS